MYFLYIYFDKDMSFLFTTLFFNKKLKVIKINICKDSNCLNS